MFHLIPTDYFGEKGLEFIPRLTRMREEWSSSSIFDIKMNHTSLTKNYNHEWFENSLSLIVNYFWRKRWSLKYGIIDLVLSSRMTSFPSSVLKHNMKEVLKSYSKIRTPTDGGRDLSYYVIRITDYDKEQN
jgi:hypothetical protein